MYTKPTFGLVANGATYDPVEQRGQLDDFRLTARRDE